MQPQVLNELADAIARPLSFVFKSSWQLGEIPESWKRASVTLIFKKGRKEDPRELQVSQTYLSPWECDGAANP